MKEVRVRDLFVAILKRDVKLMFSNRQQVTHTLLFFVISITILRIANEQSVISISSALGFSAIMLLFSLILINQNLLNDEYKNDFISQYILTGVGLEIVIIAKWLAYMITIIVPVMLAVPIGVYMLCNEIMNFELFCAVFVFSANSSLILLCTASLLPDYKKFLILVIATLPFHIPNIVFLLLICQNYQYIWASASLFLFYFPVCIILSNLSTKFIVRLSQ
ncbi:MAG: heme exporter protein CcmB [Candidatus Lariskella arthropodorum]|uniref:heme exporter protein CcmB n=1 Tax=Candidatus Lariskella endosymbiont of Epinotia ramella TaxID=3066224 RepID=UPI0030D3A6C6